MKEVSCRALDVYFRRARRETIDVGRLLVGVPHDLEYLKDKHERIDWDVLVRIMANASTIWSEEELVECGREFLRSPLLVPLAGVGRLLFTARELYHFMAERGRGGGVQLFGSIDPSIRETGPNRLEIELVIRDGYLPSREFFLISKGTFAYFPRLVGLPEAEVQLETDGRRGLFLIHYPSGGGLLAWFRKAVVWPFTVRAAARELHETHSVLKQRYLEIEETRQVIQRQATQLRTAFEISSVIHGDLDLAPTAASIARTLVQAAGFSAAEIEFTNDLEDNALAFFQRHGEVVAGADPMELSLAVRGKSVGMLRLWSASGSDVEERLELLESVVPTVCMAIGNALTFKTVSDYKDHLEQRVADRTAELERARDSLADTVRKLEQAQAARDRIFANINHEIRTPLSLILLTVDDIKSKFPDANELPVRERLAGIESSVHRLLALVDGLLLLAAGQEGKLRVLSRPCDLAAVMARMVEGWKHAALQSEVQLNYNGPPRAVASCDEVAVERAVANLISNAIRFTPPGGAITLELEADDDALEIRVRDTGIGIDEEFRERIFGRFEQGRPSVRAGQRGSGIGLSIVKEIMEAHSGSVTAKSNKAGGSTFTLHLPRAGSPAEAIADDRQVASMLSEPLRPETWKRSPEPESRVRQGQSSVRATLLVAEDDPELSGALGDLLGNEYRVLLAPDGLTAMRLAKDHLPDLLISDVGMPGMDGLELTRRFREMSGNRLAPVILLTAYSGLADRLAGFDMGAVDYVSKPFQPIELLARIHSQLEMRSLALKLHESEKLAALGTLAAGLTHEIRNPANGVVNAVGPLRALLPPEMTRAGTPVAELLGVIQDCAEQICALSRHLFGFVRQGELARSEAPIEDVIDRAAVLAQSALVGVVLERELAYRGSVVCSAALLAQVLTNLLENGAHAAGPGGKVRLSTRTQNGDLVLDIADSGPGVPPNMRSHLFEPFFTTKAPDVGHGLGLSTSRLIIERHQGRLNLIDTGGRGATFRIELPLGGGPAAPAATNAGA